MTDTELQEKSGQLWFAILAYSEARSKEASARAAKLEVRQKFFDKLLAVATEALNSGDLGELKTLLSAAVEDATQTDKEIKIAELEEQKKTAQDEADQRQADLQAEIDALNAAREAQVKE